MEDKKDFKEVKVKVTGGAKEFQETLSRSMLYSGVNIFGQLSELYLKSKDDFIKATSNASTQGASDVNESTNEGGIGLSSGVLQIFKKLQKRDPVTKVKAFQELDVYLNAMEAEAEELSNLLTFFLYHFCRILINEPDKKVREAAHATFSVFIKRDKRKLGPHIKKIFPLWVCSFFDPSPEAAKQAQDNFDAAFPKNKQSSVFLLAYKNFLHFANEQLKQSEDSVASESKQQGENTFDRVTSSVLNALGYSFTFTEDWPAEEQVHYRKKMLDILELDRPVAASLEEQDAGKGKAKQPKQTQNYMWAFLTQKYRGMVRAAALQFVTTFLVKMPDDIVQQHIPQIAPLVFSLVGEDNSHLQATLWREAIFTIGKNFADSCWNTVNIKKDFLPKLYKCLKEAAYGAQTSLYENFVKYLSVCPIYNLSPGPQPGDKLNKASFKERCNLIREVFSNLYLGLKNDEAPLFHSELVASYFESLAFILLKRVQVLQTVEGQCIPGITEADFDFCCKEVVNKLVELPVTDYIQNFIKLKSKAQSERNLRITIPDKIAKLLVDLADRDFNPSVFERICAVIQASLPNEHVNSSRIVCAVLKQSKAMKPAYQSIVFKTILERHLKQLVADLETGIPEASKSTIEAIVGKVQSYSRILISICKLKMKISDLKESGVDTSVIELKSGGLLLQFQKKEAMASKMLKSDDLDKFQTIKKQLVNMLILQLMAGLPSTASQLDTVITECLFQGPTEAAPAILSANHAMESALFDPQTAFAKKIDLLQYFEMIHNSQTLHTRLFETIYNKILVPAVLPKYAAIIDKLIKRTLTNQPSVLTLMDIDLIQSKVESHLSEQPNQCAVWFEAVQELIITRGPSTKPLRAMLFDQLLHRNPAASLWRIFSQAILQKDASSSDYENYCVAQLKASLMKLITHASRDLQSVEEFSHLTGLISQFTGLNKDKQVGLLQDIVLVPQHFERLEANPLPLKLFRDLFIEGATWDVSQLIKCKEGDKYTYVWLFATFLNFKHLMSLSNYYSLKMQLVIFVETEVMPAVIAFAAENHEGENSFVVQLCAEMARRAGVNTASQNMEATLSYMHTLEFLVSKMSDPGEDFPPEFKPVLKIDEFKEIFNQVCSPICLDLVQTNFNPTQSLTTVDIAIKILKQTAYYLLDVPLVIDMYRIAKANISAIAGQAGQLPRLLKQQAQVYIYLSKYLESEGSDTAFKIDLVNMLFDKVNEGLEGKAKDDVQDLAIELVDELLLSGHSKAMQDKIEKFDLHLTVLDMLERTADLVADGHPSDCSVQIKLCNVIRKTLTWTESSTAIVSVYMQAVKDRADWFDRKRKLMAQGQIVQGLQQFEFEMLQEMAETLLVCIGSINDDVLKARAEDNLYSLIGCGIEPLQKAAFVVLKFIYENFTLPVEFVTSEAQELQYLMEEAKKGEIMEETKDHEAHKKFKIAKAFANVPRSLVDMIENAPNVLASHDDDVHKLMTDSSNLLEQLVFGKSQEGCMNQQVFGYFLAWNAVLIKIEQGRIKSQINQDAGKNYDYMNVLASLTEYIEENSYIYEMLLVSLVGFFPPIKKGLSDSYNLELAQFAPEYCTASSSAKQSRNFCLYTLINFMKSFPSLARKFYSECDRQLHEIVLPYIKQVVSPAIMENEIKKIELSQAELGANSDLSFVLFKSTKEIIATYVKTAEISVQIKLKIPQEYPLRSVQVDLGETLKLKQGQIRKWTLSIKNLIQQRNGDIISAILLWKSNIDKEMDGVEECYICYCVMHGVDRSLPNMQCQNCKNKFHVACIRKWFSSSNKSNCPLCQTYFFQ